MLIFLKHHCLCLLLSLVLPLKAVFGAEHRIASPSEFYSFVSDVNSGNKYDGTTVYLDSDISFPGVTIDPIGIDSSNCFLGTFDGQGHVISGLVIYSSSSVHSGLFGYSEGLTVRNVVLGPSCSVTNLYSGSDYTYIGGFIGECSARSRNCDIENSVNMANVTFGGKTGGVYYSNLGGIVGYFAGIGYDFNVKNCVNYGYVTHSGTSGTSNIGGIVGILESMGNSKCVYNCLNYGTILYNGTSKSLYIGGIVGYSYSKTYIGNCVSAGKISSTETSNIGNVLGFPDSSTYINNTYYTTDVGVDSLYVYTYYEPELTDTPSSASSVDLTLINNLNNYASNKSLNKWLFNENSKNVLFKMNYNVNFSFSSNLIVLPNLTSDWRTFVGWFTDSSFETSFSESSILVDTTLYGRWDKYVVSFDANGGNVSEACKNVTYGGAYGELPKPTKEYYTFLGWFTEKTGGEEVTFSSSFTSLSEQTLYARWIVNNYTLRFVFGNGTKDEVRSFDYGSKVDYPDDPVREGYTFDGWDVLISDMPAYNLIITAQWIINNYTVTFDVNGGDELVESSIIVTLHSTYGTLPTPTKTGYMFFGWYIKEYEYITNETTVSIAGNHTLYAHWEEISNLVEIVFETKYLAKEDIEKVIREYAADERFEVIMPEKESDESRAVIKFADPKSAEDFVRNIRESDRMEDLGIKKIGFKTADDDSFSLTLYPVILINVLML